MVLYIDHIAILRTCARQALGRKRVSLKKYPKIKPYEKDLTLRVSLKGNRTYLLRKGKVLYTMLSTGGIYKKGKSLTPTGTFRIQNGRGDSFF